ncbi:hypothetical protein BaRGS_00037287 [Batillaria attramentaria]|uniref:Uncharacterized protein n=1 Tax=Batillaria attramentaria TaxID=370345 RepID=A0ABD0J9J7_9CAEN
MLVSKCQCLHSANLCRSFARNADTRRKAAFVALIGSQVIESGDPVEVPQHWLRWYRSVTTSKRALTSFAIRNPIRDRTLRNAKGRRLSVMPKGH